MRVIKRCWVFANYDHGTIFQMNNPMTKHKAIKLMENYYTENVNEYEIFENMEQVRKFEYEKDNEKC